MEAPAAEMGMAMDEAASGEIQTGTPITIRMDFNPLANFSPEVRTDVNGEAEVAISLPDNLTRYRVMVVAVDEGKKFGQATKDFRFAAAVASFGMLLRNSQHKGNATYAGVLEIATEAASGDTSTYRDDFLKMIAKAKTLSGQ